MLIKRFYELAMEGNTERMENSRKGTLAAADKYREAAAVADLVGGAQGAANRAEADHLRSGCWLRLGDVPAASSAACSSLRAARASGSRNALAQALNVCGAVAGKMPGEMAKAERESREQERLSGAPSYGLDLSQEGRISLPTTDAALFRLRREYLQAAVAVCDAALAFAMGCGSPDDDDPRRVSEHMEAIARSDLASCLDDMGEDPQRSFKLPRQAIALLRRERPPRHPTDVDAKRSRRHAARSGGQAVWRGRAGRRHGVHARSARAERGNGRRESEAGRACQPGQHVLLARPAGGARRGRGAPLPAQRALRSEREDPRHELHDLPRASRDSRAARRRDRGGRHCRRGALGWQRDRLVCKRAGVWASVPLRVPLHLAAHDVEYGVPHLQGVTTLYMLEEV